MPSLFPSERTNQPVCPYAQMWTLVKPREFNVVTYLSHCHLPRKIQEESCIDLLCHGWKEANPPCAQAKRILFLIESSQVPLISVHSFYNPYLIGSLFLDLYSGLWLWLMLLERIIFTIIYLPTSPKYMPTDFLEKAKNTGVRWACCFNRLFKGIGCCRLSFTRLWNMC